MKTLLIFSIGFLRRLIKYGRGFLGKTPIPFFSLSCFVLLATFLLFLPFITYSQPTLVKDINKIPLSVIAPLHLTSFNGVLYFSAESSLHGRELWRSDGTDAGTYLLRDITTGINSSSPSMFTVVNNTLYFVANEIHKEDYINNKFEHHYELWKTDGTPQGTIQVGYFPMQSPQINLYNAYPKLQLVATNNALYFTVNNAPAGYELWKTQGSNTGKVLDVSGDPYNPFPNAYQIGAASNYIYFTASGNTTGFALWRTNGSTAGTVLVKESNTIYGITSLTAVGDILYFAFQDPNGQELWKSNGTPQGTQVVKATKTALGGLFNANGLLYFTIETSATTQLWKSNGTAAGTVLVKDGLVFPSIQTVVGNTIYFISSFQLWKTDGTTAGTVMLKSFEQESYVSIQTSAVNNTLYVRVYVYATYELSLWKSEGTSQSTTLIQEFNPSENNVFSPFLVTLRESVYFVSEESLWKSNGTPTSTQPLYPVVLNANQGSHPSSMLNVNGLIYFIAGDGVSGFALLKTNGSEANTVLVKQNGGTGPVQKANLLTYNNSTVYFQVTSYNMENQLVNVQLWKSDGTNASTVLIKTFDTGIIGESRYWNGYLYFFTGKQLWKSNGTPLGTALVKNVNTEFIGLLTVWNNALYFRDENALWKSDGTSQGTIVLKNIDGDGIANFTPGNGLLYFTDYATGLWKTDGTPAGTVSFGPKILGINSMVFFKSALYFSAAENLYKSNGTTAGTSIIKTIVKYDENNVENLTVVGNSLYFTFLSISSDLTSYNELWKSDGTPAGTQVVKLVRAQNLKAVNNTLLFEISRVLNGKSANQLWRSNGTSANTSLVAELSVQLTYSAIAANSFYFSGNDGNRGYELWKYDVEACMQAPVTNLLLIGSTVCVGENGKITIKGSQTSFTYQAYFNNGSPAGTAIMGGGDITLTIPAVSLNTGNNIFTIKAGGCVLTPLTNSATITFTATCATSCSATGSILQEKWLNITGSSVSAIPVNTAPSSSTQLTSFETTSNTGDNYGERIRGYLCVPTTGSYTFYIAGDDKCELYLSSDDDPAKKARIASVPYYTGLKVWNKYPEQKSVAISLVAGKKYYIEALHKEATGGDNVAVGWQTSSTAAISVITGSYLSPYIPQGAGKISREFWANVTGYQVSNIPLTIAPTTTNELTIFETAANQGNTYGQRFRGYIHPQVSGNYQFFVAGDDKAELWLSSDEDPAKKTKVASITAPTSLRQWNKYASQQSALIALVAGKKYYIEALHKENSGDDNISVGWQLPSQTTISVITGTYLSPFLASPTANIARVAVEESFESNLSLYPNPFESKLSLTSSHQDKLYISIVDNLGRTVYQSTIQGTQAELNLAHLKVGVYMMKISAEDGSTQVMKVVKK
ncbi:T9SS type A sorting domain-containing protein [Rhodocytophaga rosea]|uniref:T9SS type A sorting domain-containing protein n=1 Tax=Rhodocytophaga rosea TaxID=2704465 RepID=A0A6C0GSF1_9BACT|nr:ELWxxDGT repeat protein [Rhodocytophaga rosea]QHT70452.1 T9SS type A sorting domain-containing protein [Rhodocytophaga rosea]